MASPSIWQIALVALGSATGGVVRFLLSSLPHTVGGFPWATFSINVGGSLLIGAVSGLVGRFCAGTSAGEIIRAVAIVGFCGGFTTFSTFSNDTFRMLSSGQWPQAVAYAFGSVVAGVTAVLIGSALTAR